MYRAKEAWMVAATLAVGLVLADQALAFRSGPPSGRNGSTASGGATCSQCHGSASGSGSVQILGVPSAYEANATYTLNVRVEDPVQAGAGFQLSVEDASGNHVGTLVITDPTNTQPNAGWVNHTSTGVSNSVANWAANGNSATFTVDWTAPANDVGTVTFWAVGNAINNNFSSSGDIVYLTNVSADFSFPVPAASTWGLVALTLVMLVSASILIARRTRPLPARA